MDNYYSKINEGGPAASRGWEYQDLCAIRYFFDYVDEEDFLSLTLEQTNDFSVLFKTKEMVFQVKDYKISKMEINEILACTGKSDNICNYIIAPSWNSFIANIIQKKKEYHNACSAKRSDEQTKAIQEQIMSVIDKNGYSSNAMVCNFEIVNKEELEEKILYRICTWNRIHGYDADEKLVLKQLVAIVQKQRGVRGSLNDSTLKYIVQNSRVEKRKMNTQKFMNYHKENILASLNVLSNEKIHFRELINLIIAYIEHDEYAKALDKLNELVIEMQDAEIYRAWVLLQLGNYKEAEQICNNILNRNVESVYSSAYFYKGIVNYYKKKYKKAYTYICKSIQFGNQITYEQAAYLSKIEIRLNKSLEEAKELLKQCIEMESKDSEIYYELALLSQPHEAIELLTKSLDYDSNNYKARFRLAEYYRILGSDLLAYNQYKIYFSEFENLKNWRALQGIVYCLINIGNKEEAESYMLQFMSSFINSAANKIKDHQTVILMDLTWNEVKMLTCTKENNMYRFSSPLGEYCIPARSNYGSMENKDGIGTFPDNLSWMYETLQSEISEREFNVENAVKPVFIANYDDDFLFLSKKYYLIKNDIAHLNHDWIEKVNNDNLGKCFYMLKTGDELHYQEYDIRAEDIKIIMYEYSDRIQVEVIYKNSSNQVSVFSKGNGYFNFRKALEKSKWLSWYFFSVNRKELIDLCIPAESVSIKCC